MANFYIKRLLGNETTTEVRSGISNANGGSIISDGQKVGIYKQSQSASYNGITNPVGNVTLSQIPQRNYMQSAITNNNVKNVFKKFFTNTSGDDHTTDTSRTWSQGSNLNAFAYMKANMGPFNS